MRGRLLVIAFALVATPATAAPKSCATLVDEDLAGPPSSMDIRKAEMSYDTRRVSIRLTLDTTRAGNDPADMAGYWGVRIRAAGVEYGVHRRRVVDTAERYEYGFSGGRLIKTAVTPTSITWTFDRKAVPQLRTQKVRPCVVLSETKVAGVTADSAA